MSSSHRPREEGARDFRDVQTGRVWDGGGEQTEEKKDALREKAALVCGSGRERGEQGGGRGNLCN